VEAFQRVHQTGQPESLEYSMQVGAGPRWFLANINPVQWPDGTFRTVSMLARDITERKSLEDQLRQAQKMEAIGELAGGVAHDFNNLLSVITGYAELLLNRPAEPTVLRSQLEQIKQAGDRAASLTQQLLAFSRQLMLEPRLVDLNSLTLDSKLMLSRLIGEDIAVHTALARELGLVMADPGQVSQIIINLAVNARDAMPTGGRLTLETANVDLDPHYAQDHLGVRPGRYVMLAVSDTGGGMDAETQARIFEPFFTTKEVGKGTGLGLSTVYGIVQQSGGHTAVYSEPGHGSTFKVYLPRVEDPSLPQEEAPIQIAPLGTETILVVEDDTAVRHLTITVLEGCGYTVVATGEPDEALFMVEQRGDAIDLLLTDVVMPGLSGRQLVEQLRVAHPLLKVLYTSGYTEDAIVRHGVLTAECAFIGKPASPLALAQKVRAVLDQTTS
jgi:signal transduction histidine kinase/ActR/RegA family two-component response regulator